jgi:hypothetical protein
VEISVLASRDGSLWVEVCVQKAAPCYVLSLRHRTNTSPNIFITMILQASFAAAAFTSLISLAYGIPASTSLYRRATLDDWIASETSTALAGILANAGSTGAKSYGAVQGLLLASPSTTDPDCEQGTQSLRS